MRLARLLIETVVRDRLFDATRGPHDGEPMGTPEAASISCGHEFRMASTTPCGLLGRVRLSSLLGGLVEQDLRRRRL